jgi:hypothetical protein
MISVTFYSLRNNSIYCLLILQNLINSKFQMAHLIYFLFITLVTAQLDPTEYFKGSQLRPRLEIIKPGI